MRLSFVILSHFMTTASFIFQPQNHEFMSLVLSGWSQARDTIRRDGVLGVGAFFQSRRECRKKDQHQKDPATLGLKLGQFI